MNFGSGSCCFVTLRILRCFARPINAADLSGPTLDGDTVKVLTPSLHPERICLSSIDRPEESQAFGNRAKQAASALVFGKDVILQTHSQDKYGRTLAEVLLPDGVNLNQELVKQGWCWWYRKYAPLDTELERLEGAARGAKRGLWADPAPIPPWAYHKTRRGQDLDLSDVEPFGTGKNRGSYAKPYNP